jgi:hypothetical protein
MAVTNDQSQKVTESPVEINFSLMKVIARIEQCAALEREVVLLSGILITNAIALALPTLAEKPARGSDNLSQSIRAKQESNEFVHDLLRPM